GRVTCVVRVSTDPRRVVQPVEPLAGWEVTRRADRRCDTGPGCGSVEQKQHQERDRPQARRVLPGRGTPGLGDRSQEADGENSHVAYPNASDPQGRDPGRRRRAPWLLSVSCGVVQPG